MYDHDKNVYGCILDFIYYILFYLSDILSKNCISTILIFFEYND